MVSLVIMSIFVLGFAMIDIIGLDHQKISFADKHC